VTNPAPDVLATPESDQSMPSGDAFIDGYFTEALVSPEARDGDRPTEATTVDPHGIQRR
jgi:hypothetical protein